MLKDMEKKILRYWKSNKYKTNDFKIGWFRSIQLLLKKVYMINMESINQYTATHQILNLCTDF